MIHLTPAQLERLSQNDVRSELALGLRGIEKESLRVTPEGRIAHTPHPAALGSALTHPRITTDYSEALLELVTSPERTVQEAWTALHEIHQVVYSHLDDELLWATSMPCALGGDADIPVAVYGRSNVGMMKHIYRRGLGHRYGRVMQVIAGVHFNYSIPVSLWPVLQSIDKDSRPLRQYIDDRYFGLLRNFQRLGWIVPYLFGSSPAVCKSFLGGGLGGSLSEYDADTAYGRYATSLRMSDIGYHNPSQAELNISYNNLGEYVDGLQKAIFTPYPPYERLGVRQNGDYQQLTTSILQIANEYYSFARPKQIAMSGEKPTLALKRRGVAYIEVRALDVDPFSPIGISQDSMRFIETLLLFCLFTDSPAATAKEKKINDLNQSRSACCGRAPGAMLTDGGTQKPLVDWAIEICESLLPVARLVDGEAGGPYEAAVRLKLAEAGNPEATPSARVLAEMREREEPFFAFALRRSREYHEQFRKDLPRELTAAAYDEMAAASLARQAEIEASDSRSFEEYLQDYFAQA